MKLLFNILKTMRIALLTSFFPPDTQSGIARYVEDLAYALIERGLDITVIAAGSSKCVEQRGKLIIYWVPSFRNTKQNFLFPAFRYLLTSFRMWKILRVLHTKKPFDIIEAPNTESNGIASLILGLPSPKPLFVNRMSSPKSIFPKKSFLPRVSHLLENCQAKLATGYLSNSQENLIICEKAYKIINEKPRKVILHGLPTKKILHKVPPTLKTKLNILFLGRMELRKGFDILASAWPYIVAEVPEANLIVAGEDLPYQQGNSFFQWAIRDMPLYARDKLEYHGIISSEYRDSLYRESYLCVMPSRYESFGLVLIETMQYGLPVVSTKVGGIPEVIQNGKTGLLVPQDDPESLSKAVIQLLKDPALYQKIRNNLADEFQKRFTIERVAEHTEAFYLSLTNGS